MSNKHNEGQTDASEGKNERPHSHTEKFFTWDQDSLKELHHDNDQYQKGQDHHKSQTE